MRRLAKSTIAILLLCTGLLLPLSSPVFAQEATKDTLVGRDADSSDSLVSQIISAAEEDGVRIIVIDGTTQKDKSAGPKSNGIWSPTPADHENLTMTMTPSRRSSFTRIQTEVLHFREILKAKFDEIPESIKQTRNELARKSPTGDLKPYVRALYWSVLLLAFGAWLEHLIYINHIVARWLKPDLLDNPIGYLDKLPLLLKRAALKIIGVIISMLIAFAVGATLFNEPPPKAIQFTIAVLYLGYAACRIVAIIWRLILAPFLSQYRIPNFSNKDALKLYHWLWIISSINILMIVIGIWVGELGGESHLHATMASVFSGCIATLNILMVVANRKALSRAIRNGKSLHQTTTFPRILSKIWLLIAIGYFAFTWIEMTYRVVIGNPVSTTLIAAAYGILISIICAYAIMNYFIERFFQNEKRYVPFESSDTTDLLATNSTDPVSETLIETPDAQHFGNASGVIPSHPLNTYQDLARRVAGVLSILVGVWALGRIRNIDSEAMFSSTADRSLDAIAILFIGYIVYHIVRIWIDNKIQEEGGETSLEPGDEGGASSASRLATLLPLFRNFMLAVIFLSVIFSALLEMGINVSPLFASAGVVGLAIGFGAQTLVRDIFSGAFYLFDDAFRRGEYVDIGGVKGTVEKISVRSFQLRHHLGPLHTIPFGEITSLTNYSRDWVMMKLPLRLTYDTDPEQVRKLIKKLGQSLLEDPEIGHTFLQPLKSQGVLEMQDSAMIFRVKFMAKPGDQWVIRKRVYQEIRDLFAREGINFAHKQVTVRLEGDTPQNLTEQQTKAITGAALNDEEDDYVQDEGDDR